MLVQETNTKLDNRYEWGIDRSKDELVKALVDTGLWRIHPRGSNQRYIGVMSNMEGFSDGRYTIMVRALKRKYKGNTHHIAIYWTPYNMDCKWIGYVSSKEELMNVIKSVNENLLDPERKY